MAIDENRYDLVVVGGTPAGVMSAIAAARLGSRVALVEYHAHIGGMTTSGLGKSDIENRDAIAGMFKEFTERIRLYYLDKYGPESANVQLCRQGYYYEPSVAEAVFNEMVVAEKNIIVWLEHRIEKATVASGRLTTALFRDRRSGGYLSLEAEVFIDATYEGDLYARAGAAYRLGREGRSDFNERHAGKIFFDHNDHVILSGSTGEGDGNLPAYTYRLCLTDDPKNSFVLEQPPEGYDRDNYKKYIDDLNEGRLGGPKVLKEGHGYYPAHFNTMLRVFSFAEIPNRKYDVNINPRPLGFPFPEENKDYVEASWGVRERIFQKHRELILGLLYFVQNDPEVSEDDRKMAMQYHLPLDEFEDAGHFPWQFYVREARRLKGKYTLTENNFNPPTSNKRSTIFPDTVVAGEFPIDSFPVTQEPSVDKKVLEGYICMLEIAPYQIPLRIMLPETLPGIIVPVAASTSHVAYSTIRMEPLWMCLGQAAGLLAHLAVQKEVRPDAVPVPLLQKLLIEKGQIITYFYDLDRMDKAFNAAQFWGTKGFFSDYYARLRDPLEIDQLQEWLTVFDRELNRRNGHRFDEIKGQNGCVSISEFVFFMQSFVNDEKAKNFLGSKEWFYFDRDPKTSILRGEVCLILYKIYFMNQYE